ncbi:MAG: RNA polymerase sigma factor [Sedimentisphaerales bacterium]|nr:RNA polymerase sigma factor [Sedimentisphaerales bacterium]
MNNRQEHAELIEKARLGDRESLDRLAEAARVCLREYVLRLTLREDLTEDIVQESILEMFKVFDKLKKADRFWAWLHGIAFNKIRGHYGRQWRHKTTSLSDIDHEITTEENQNALADMINRELKLVVLKSMRELSPRHRAVLTMRCYKEMGYSDIAVMMGCSELGAQALFYRAKKALAKKLSSHGLGKRYLLTALVLFGKLTASTEAAAANISVTAASLKVGTTASLAAIITGKTVVVSLTTAGLITAGTLAFTSAADNKDDRIQQTDTHTSFNTPQKKLTEQIVEQFWYFFPEGPEGPVMLRFLEFSESGRQSFCKYLQNEHANYSSSNTTVHKNNFRMYNPDLSVKRLPTDSRELTDFISSIAGKPDEMEYVCGKGKGLLVISRRSGDIADKIWRIDRHHNVLKEEYFQFDWPDRVKIIDNRDQMHRRGWTYFTISGHLNGHQISGIGQIPFVYATSKRFSPWFKMQIGNKQTIRDGIAKACVFDRSGNDIATYTAGSFLKGLGRPWIGLHTIDTVRRDAAEYQMSFETRKTIDTNKVKIVLKHEQLRLVYTIDMETDVIEKIEFSNDNGNLGELRFTYLQNIDNPGLEFNGSEKARPRKTQQNPDTLWLVKLINNSW